MTVPQELSNTPVTLSAAVELPQPVHTEIPEDTATELPQPVHTDAPDATATGLSQPGLLLYRGKFLTDVPDTTATGLSQSGLLLYRGKFRTDGLYPEDTHPALYRQLYRQLTEGSDDTAVKPPGQTRMLCMSCV